MHGDAFGFGFFNFLECGRHLVALLQADQMNLARAHAHGRERNVDYLAGGDGGDIGLGGFGVFDSGSVLADHLARGRAGDVHGDIAAANHDDFFPDGEFVAEVDVEQEINALVNAVEVHPGNGEVAAAVCADGNEDGIEALPAQAGDGKVAPGGLIELQGNVAGLKDFTHLRFDHIAGE